MLEILLLKFLCGKISTMMRNKARRPAGYCVLLCLFWFLGEFGAAVLAMILSGDGDKLLMYLGALAGAAAGAGTAFWIARSMSSLLPLAGGFPVIQSLPTTVRVSE